MTYHSRVLLEQIATRVDILIEGCQLSLLLIDYWCLIFDIFGTRSCTTWCDDLYHILVFSLFNY